MSRIILSERAVERLVFDGEEWTLETSAWQKLDRDIFAKVPVVASGREAIVAALREIGADASLTSQVNRHIDRPPARTSTFVLRDGQLHLEAPEPEHQPKARPKARESYGMRLEDLRTELETLRERVRYLENFLEGVDAEQNSSSNENGLTDEHSTLDAI